MRLTMLAIAPKAVIRKRKTLEQAEGNGGSSPTGNQPDLEPFVPLGSDAGQILWTGAVGHHTFLLKF